MKSKISCFNPAIMKKDWKWLWGASLGLFLVLAAKGVISLLLNMAYMKTANDRFDMRFQVIASHITPLYVWVMAGFSVIMAIICFSYLFDKRANQMMHAMPITRNTLFFTHYVDGLVALLLPLVLNLLLIMPVLGDGMMIRAMAGFYGFLFLAALIFYSAMVFMCMLCGVAYLPPILFLVFMELFEGLRVLLESVLRNVVYGFGESYFYSESAPRNCLLSPLYALCRASFVGFREPVDRRIYFWFDKGFFWYIPVALIFALLALWAYKKRPIESIGDFFVMPWLKVLFSVGITGCAAMVVYAWLTSYEQEAGLIDSMGKVNPFIIGIAGFVGFLIVSMIIRKTLHIKKKVVLIPAVITTVVLFIGAAGVQMDLFGLASWTPKASDVEVCELQAFMSGNRPGELFSAEEVIDLHKRFLAEREHLQSTREGNIYEVGFTYRLKNGNLVSRRYTLPYSEEDLKDKNSLLSIIAGRYADYNSFCPELKDMKWVDVSLAHSGDDGEFYSQILEECGVSTEEMKEAVLKDIQDGNLKTFYLESENMDRYGDKVLEKNELSITAGWEEGLTINSNELGKSLDVWITSDTDNKYGVVTIPFNSECKHILKVLKKGGYTHNVLTEKNGTKFPVK
ncbi:MAG: hypothetical protein E7280_11455 [Lachnospiraceae bacterium]|nr:hypothetical protein [Lachnospiraceae bacterium]